MNCENTNIKKLLYFYERVLDEMNIGVHVINEDGKTVIYNRKMREMEGMEIEDVLDKNLLDVFSFHQNDDSTLLKALYDGKMIKNVKQTYFNINDHEITTVNDTFPIELDGKMIGAMEIAQDVTKFEKLIRENILKKEDTRFTFENIIGLSPQIKEVIEMSKRATKRDSSVLIIGETGTGKELFAQSIHNGSDRAVKPFISQNCAAIPDHLLEGLLFGTVKGAFTGSIDRPGLFEQANGGTLLLDEINSLNANLQAKLLRALQEKTVRRIGATKDYKIDVRIIATMNEDPIDAIANGSLRKDLFYKLSVITLFIPPLRERKDDIKELIQFFIDYYNQRFQMSVLGVNEVVMEKFLHYDWPGNVRELEHLIEGAMSLMDQEDLISYSHLPIPFRQKQLHTEPSPASELDQLSVQKGQQLKSLDQFLEEAETFYLQKALQVNDFNITQTANALGMSRQNLQYRVRKLGLKKT